MRRNTFLINSERYYQRTKLNKTKAHIRIEKTAVEVSLRELQA